MIEKQINRRIAAVKTADAINAIEGAPVSRYAQKRQNIIDRRTDEAGFAGLPSETGGTSK